MLTYLLLWLIESGLVIVAGFTQPLWVTAVLMGVVLGDFGCSLTVFLVDTVHCESTKDTAIRLFVLKALFGAIFLLAGTAGWIFPMIGTSWCFNLAMMVVGAALFLIPAFFISEVVLRAWRKISAWKAGKNKR